MLNMFLKSTKINIIQDTTMAFESKPGVCQRTENLEDGPDSESGSMGYHWYPGKIDPYVIVVLSQL